MEAVAADEAIGAEDIASADTTGECGRTDSGCGRGATVLRQGYGMAAEDVGGSGGPLPLTRPQVVCTRAAAVREGNGGEGRAAGLPQPQWSAAQDFLPACCSSPLSHIRTRPVVARLRGAVGIPHDQL